MQTETESIKTDKKPLGYWHQTLRIAASNFQHKSLCDWAANIAIGCNHACRFCYVPSTSVNKQKKTLKKYGVGNPDTEWGDYVLLRKWDEKAFLASLKNAEQQTALTADGNRAVMYSTTTDPYQVLKDSALNAHLKLLVRRSLELIRDQSTLNVRILTRSPLVKRDFKLLSSFGDRLVLGMSVPTLNNKLAKVYEPKAPSPSKRLDTLKAAKDAGVNIYVAVAPTYAECDEDDIKATLAAVKKLEPLTIYHEPINIRAENVARIQAHAATLGVEVRADVFESLNAWRRYALNSLRTVQRVATELEVVDRLHLWPDSSLLSEKPMLALLKSAGGSDDDAAASLSMLKAWIEEGWWKRVSEWPGKENDNSWSVPALPNNDLLNKLFNS